VLKESHHVSRAQNVDLVKAHDLGTTPQNEGLCQRQQCGLGVVTCRTLHIDQRGCATIDHRPELQFACTEGDLAKVELPFHHRLWTRKGDGCPMGRLADATCFTQDTPDGGW
jgi:hypothetical protein